MNKGFGNQQSKNINEYQKNFIEEGNYSAWPVESASVTFDLGDDVWDDFDDDSLLVDNSFLTSVETPVLGKNDIKFQKFFIFICYKNSSDLSMDPDGRKCFVLLEKVHNYA